jgi:hypothetical protein
MAPSACSFVVVNDCLLVGANAVAYERTNPYPNNNPVVKVMILSRTDQDINSRKGRKKDEKEW